MTDDAERSVLLVDLDGTLTDPAEGIVGSFRHALEAMGCAAAAGRGPDLDHRPAAQALVRRRPRRAGQGRGGARAYRARYGATGLFEAVVYDGAPEALAALRARGRAPHALHVEAQRLCRRASSSASASPAFRRRLRRRARRPVRRQGRPDRPHPRRPEARARGLRDARRPQARRDRREPRTAIPTIGALWGYGGEAELAAAGAASSARGRHDVPGGVRAPFLSRSRRGRSRAMSQPLPPPPRAAPRRRRPVQKSAHGVSVDRRLRLAPGRELAGGAARPGRARARHPRAARGRERLRRRGPRADAGAAGDARRRDAGAASGGRQRAAAGGRALGLLHALPPRRPASPRLPPGRATAATETTLLDGDALAARQGLLQPRGGGPFARPRETRLGRRRPRLGASDDPRPRPRHRRGPRRPRRQRRPTTSSGPATRPASSMSSRTRTTVRSG